MTTITSSTSQHVDVATAAFPNVSVADIVLADYPKLPTIGTITRCDLCGLTIGLRRAALACFHCSRPICSYCANVLGIPGAVKTTAVSSSPLRIASLSQQRSHVYKGDASKVNKTAGGSGAGGAGGPSSSIDPAYLSNDVLPSYMSSLAPSPANNGHCQQQQGGLTTTTSMGGATTTTRLVSSGAPIIIGTPATATTTPMPSAAASPAPSPPRGPRTGGGETTPTKKKESNNNNNTVSIADNHSDDDDGEAPQPTSSTTAKTIVDNALPNNDDEDDGEELLVEAIPVKVAGPSDGVTTSGSPLGPLASSPPSAKRKMDGESEESAGGEDVVRRFPTTNSNDDNDDHSPAQEALMPRPPSHVLETIATTATQSVPVALLASSSSSPLTAQHQIITEGGDGESNAAANIISDATGLNGGEEDCFAYLRRIGACNSNTTRPIDDEQNPLTTTLNRNLSRFKTVAKITCTDDGDSVAFVPMGYRSCNGRDADHGKEVKRVPKKPKYGSPAAGGDEDNFGGGDNYTQTYCNGVLVGASSKIGNDSNYGDSSEEGEDDDYIGGLLKANKNASTIAAAATMSPSRHALSSIALPTDEYYYSGGMGSIPDGKKDGSSSKKGDSEKASKKEKESKKGGGKSSNNPSAIFDHNHGVSAQPLAKLQWSLGALSTSHITPNVQKVFADAISTRRNQFAAAFAQQAMEASEQRRAEEARHECALFRCVGEDVAPMMVSLPHSHSDEDELFRTTGGNSAVAGAAGASSSLATTATTALLNATTTATSGAASPASAHGRAIVGRGFEDDDAEEELTPPSGAVDALLRNVPLISTIPFGVGNAATTASPAGPFSSGNHQQQHNMVTSIRSPPVSVSNRPASGPLPPMGGAVSPALGSSFSPMTIQSPAMSFRQLPSAANLNPNTSNNNYSSLPQAATVAKFWCGECDLHLPREAVDVTDNTTNPNGTTRCVSPIAITSHFHPDFAPYVDPVAQLLQQQQQMASASATAGGKKGGSDSKKGSATDSKKERTSYVKGGGMDPLSLSTQQHYANTSFNFNRVGGGGGSDHPLGAVTTRRLGDGRSSSTNNGSIHQDPLSGLIGGSSRDFDSSRQSSFYLGGGGGGGAGGGNSNNLSSLTNTSSAVYIPPSSSTITTINGLTVGNSAVSQRSHSLKGLAETPPPQGMVVGSHGASIFTAESTLSSLTPARLDGGGRLTPATPTDSALRPAPLYGMSPSSAANSTQTGGGGGGGLSPSSPPSATATTVANFAAAYGPQLSTPASPNTRNALFVDKLRTAAKCQVCNKKFSGGIASIFGAKKCFCDVCNKIVCEGKCSREVVRPPTTLPVALQEQLVFVGYGNLLGINLPGTEGANVVRPPVKVGGSPKSGSISPGAVASPSTSAAPSPSPPRSSAASPTNPQQLFAPTTGSNINSTTQLFPHSSLRIRNGLVKLTMCNGCMMGQ